MPINYRTILHSDLNSFFASVEIALNPSLRGKAVAVCGSQEDRHGIVLAKSEPAKRAGIKTGMANWQAQQLCPQLIIVHPHYDQYKKYSEIVRHIYQRYSNLVEPYGMDECWIDVSASQLIGSDGLQIAEDIRQTVKKETGLTVSIGISFTKSFAKLGSDMKKPDAITVLSPQNFREKVWPLPVNELIFVGRATTHKLRQYGIRTIGALAQAPCEFVQRLLGQNGLKLWQAANGLDASRVMPMDFCAPIKSLSHGTTCTADLRSEQEIWQLILYLMQKLGAKLLSHNLRAYGVSLCIRDSNLLFHSYQCSLSTPTQNPAVLSRACWQLFQSHYHWPAPVRALTVGATKLSSALLPYQLSLFEPLAEESPNCSPTSSGLSSRLIPVQPSISAERQDAFCQAVEQIRQKFGAHAIRPAVLLSSLPLPKIPNESQMPSQMYI
ncbi:MAG: DNA polymerase IV [bacterium]|nr:DNA polymerase IV [bacterium]